MDPVILLLLSSVTTDCLWLLIFTRFLDHTQRRTTVGRTSLDGWSVRRRDLYLTTHTALTTDKHPYPPTCWGFLVTLKNPTASAGFEHANLGTKGQHATSRPLGYQRPARYLYTTWVPKASTLPLDHLGTKGQYATSRPLGYQRPVRYL